MPYQGCLTAIALCGILFFSDVALPDQNIGGLGYITPHGDIVDMTGPGGEVIDSVYVKQGDVVEAGMPLVSFQSRSTLRTELDLARLALHEATDVNGKAIAIQNLEIALQTHHVEMAQRRLNKVEEAGGDSFSPRQMEQYTDELFVAQNGLQRAQLELEKLKLEREISVDRATRRVELAQERYNRSVLRARRRGTILEVNARIGETAGGAPLVRMADLDRMYVLCEIFEADLTRLSRGMKATITSNSLPAMLEGEVESIGMIIDQRSQMGKVMIRLFNAKPVARLIHMQVNVSIQTP